MTARALAPMLVVLLAISACGSRRFTSRAAPTKTFPLTWAEQDAKRAIRADGAHEAGLVAVLPFDLRAAGFADEATAIALEEAIRTVSGDALTPRGFTVLAGETTLAVLEDNGVDAAKACEGSCALEVARELKARLFLSGSVARTEGEYVAFVRLYEIERGRQLASVQLEGATVKELRRAFAAAAGAFFERGLGALAD